MIVIDFNKKYREQIESGEMQVETREGNKVRIVCWDVAGKKPILGLVSESGNYERPQLYNENGRINDVGFDYNPKDLEIRCYGLENKLKSLYAKMGYANSQLPKTMNANDAEYLCETIAMEFTGLDTKRRVIK